MNNRVHNYKKLPILALCFVLLLSLVAMFILPTTTTAFADTQEISTINNVQ